MSKQDRQGVRTAQDLERKYNLAGMKKAVEQSDIAITKINKTQEEFANEVIEKFLEVQDSMDNVISTWYLNGEPTLLTEPTISWEDYDSHVGDQYYDRDTGYAYRFEKVGDAYKWEWIQDKDIIEALALADSAKDTADGKRRVFLAQPTPPYDRGDLWLKDKELYVCQIAKTEGEYEAVDFVIATKYTDDTVALGIGQNLEKNYTNTVDMEAKIKASQEEISTEMSKTYSTKEELSGVDKVVKEVKTTATQTAEKFEWIVKSGTSETDFEITERMASLTAEQINLKGLVIFSGLDSETQDLINGASNDASDAKQTVDELKEAADNGEFKGEDATTLRIDSSRGTVFKNSAVSTVLSAVIYKGSKRITDITALKEEYGDSAYLEWQWQRMGEETFGTILSTDSRIGNDGFTFTLSPDDVDTKVVFLCNLITD